MTTTTSPLATSHGNDEVWRVGYRPQPWAWPSWRYATDGRFSGRWDDAKGNFRTIYFSAHLLGCLLEVLACFRVDPELVFQLSDIAGDLGPDETAVAAGAVPRSWLEPRAAACARLTGTYAAITDAESIASLRPRFLHRARAFGLDDIDAATLKDSRARALTQEMASFIYDSTGLDGIQFLSRHGDDHTLWAIFERPDDPEVSPHLQHPKLHELTPETPEIAEAFRIHHLTWADE